MNMGGLTSLRSAKKLREFTQGLMASVLVVELMTSFAAHKPPLIHPNGFREYDARWLYPKDIDLAGMRAVGLGLGTLLHERGRGPDIVAGHDYRSYSEVVQ